MCPLQEPQCEVSAVLPLVLSRLKEVPSKRCWGQPKEFGGCELDSREDTE